MGGQAVGLLAAARLCSHCGGYAMAFVPLSDDSALAGLPCGLLLATEALDNPYLDHACNLMLVLAQPPVVGMDLGTGGKA